jgi:Terpene synthase family 2, C-terminal metal binding
MAEPSPPHLPPHAVLPRLYCPFPTAIHPLVAAAEAGTLAWSRRFGLAGDPAVHRRLEATRPARLAARVCPHSTAQGLAANTDWQTWLFLFDDAFCDESDTGYSPGRSAEVAARVLRVVEGASECGADSDPFLASLAELRDRLRVLAGPERFDRFAARVTGYLLALVWEAAHRERHATAGLAEYVDLRRHSGAVPTCLALIETVNDFCLPPEARLDPDLREAVRAVTDATSWANDILSFRKETERSTQVLSLPAVLVRERGLTVAQALRAAADMHDARVHEYERIEARLLARADAALGRFLADLRFWMSGNLAWSYETGRYEASATA